MTTTQPDRQAGNQDYSGVAVGVTVAAAVFALFRGAVWARAVAVLMASLSIITNFMWIPHYPLWSLTVIAFGAFVIWAVTAHGRDIVDS